MRAGKRRITFAGWQLGAYGGLETRIIAAVDLALEAGYDVSVLTARANPPGSPTERALRGRDCRSVIGAWEAQPAVRLERLARRLVGTAQRRRPLTESERRSVGHRRAMAQVGRYWHGEGRELLQRTDVLHLFGPPRRFLVDALLAAHSAGVPTVYQSVHAVTAGYAADPLRRDFVETCNYLDLILVTQQQQSADFHTHFRYRGPVLEIGQWAYGIESELLAIDRVAIAGNQPVVIGSLNRLDPVKGIDRLIRAFAAICGKTNAVLRIGGDGPELSALRTLCARMGVDRRVEFTGYVSDRVGFYRGIDIFVIASDAEGGPVTGVEAMAAGLPVVSTSVGAMPDRLEGGAGILLDSHEPSELNAALEDLCESANHRSMIGSLARSRYIGRYSSTSHAERLLKMWAHVIHTHGSADPRPTG